MNLRDRVLQRMKELGLNENQLSKKMGYKNNSTISGLINGRNQTFRDMPRLAKGLETTVENLLGLNNSNDEQKQKIQFAPSLSNSITTLILSAPPSLFKELVKPINKEKAIFYETMAQQDLQNGLDPIKEKAKYDQAWEIRMSIIQAELDSKERKKDE